MNPTLAAMLLAVPMILLGVASAYFQLRARTELNARKLVDSDELIYLRGRYRRRLLAAVILIAVGGMIAGSYLSGHEAAADNLKPRLDDAGNKLPMNDAEKKFLRTYWSYWVGVILLAFALCVIGIMDAWASRRYFLSVYRHMKEDHQAILRRDLAIYKQQKDDRGAKRGEL